MTVCSAPAADSRYTASIMPTMASHERESPGGAAPLARPRRPLVRDVFNLLATDDLCLATGLTERARSHPWPAAACDRADECRGDHA